MEITRRLAYLPVSCDLVDQLEILATSKENVNLKIGDSLNPYRISTSINTWYTKNKEEFAIISKVFHIRLDKIRSINGIPFDSSCSL